ncbi:MAG: PA14 domain-containing protein [Kiritimatiellae bacterium]|jgi:hypothetical protein|nr:PA14 domain-containing protein [Kiritimatiellia bacterium]
MSRNKWIVTLVFVAGLMTGATLWHLPSRLLPGLALRSSGTGWKAKYQNAFPEQESWTRQDLQSDAEIYFPEDTHPVPDIQQPFRTRLTGDLLVNQGGDYTFITRVRGGIQLWINDILIIDTWQSVVPENIQTKQTPTFHLVKGVHSIWIQTIHRTPDLPRFKVTWRHGSDPNELPLGYPWIYQR